MAKPPDGSSAWYHSSDSFQMHDDDGADWAMLSTPVGRDQLCLSFPIEGQVSSYFYAVEIRVRGAGGVEWSLHHPQLPRPTSVRWTAATPFTDLVPYPDIPPRGSHGAREGRVASMRPAPDGVDVVDTAGRTRVRFMLGVPGDDDPPGATREQLGDGAVTFVLYAGPTGPVTRIATSQP